MKVTITGNRLSGTVEAVSSKSDGHRKIIAAALSKSTTQIFMNNFSDDIDATLYAIKALGGDFTKTDRGVKIIPIGIPQQDVHLNFRESGSTARFLLPIASALCDKISAEGMGRLPERPLFELTNQMRAHGINVDRDFLPLHTERRLSGGDFELRGDISSQYLTGLLFTLPLLSEKSKIRLTTPLASAPYVDMTVDVLREFGVNTKICENEYSVSGTYESPAETAAEGDWSSAAFWIAADKICGGISVSGLNMHSHQGDRQILELLDEKNINAEQIPDLVPILSVLAAARCGKTVIHGAKRLRMKESDRLKAMTECINNLGGNAKMTDDGMEIVGTGELLGGRVDGFGDHRVVMSAAIASLICKNDVEICGAEAVKKSYPNFFEHFKRLGGKYVSDGE